ncbi:MerR family transcriptional regulator [Agromyces sp. SYSU T00266]|uniref:MerR family transcriptional regulator n=1 Tax=Agromyces zhanjiangensis TaxID=3158562 RepID=UPI003394E286
MAIDATTAERTYSIGELADRTGMTVHTLRWYESQGLFPADVPRTATGRRVYGEDAVRWLRLLARLRESGMPISDIAAYSDLVRAGRGNEGERVALMEAHARSLDEQIEQLIAAREVIRAKVSDYRRMLAERGIELPPGEPA